MKFVLLLALCVARFASAIDVRFSELVANGAVTDFGIELTYTNKTLENFVPYPHCDGSNDVCPALNWDDDAELRLTLSIPAKNQINVMKSVGGKAVTGAVEYKIEACFETPFTKNRKWRKAKDIIQDDKRCAKKLVDKTALPDTAETATHTYTIKSDIPRARFFVTVFVFCNVEGESKTQHCGIDTTAPLSNLAKGEDLAKRLDGETTDDVYARENGNRSPDSSFRTDVIASRPTELVVCVILLSCLSVTLLVLYFVYERALKKET